MATAAELRALATQLDEIEALEIGAQKAKLAYRKSPDDVGLKAAHRAASQALADARSATRSTTPVIITGKEG